MKYLTLIVPLLFVGCLTTSPADRALFQGIDQAWVVVGPEYRTYVDQDSTLNSETKITRIRTADLISKALETAKGAK